MLLSVTNAAKSYGGDLVFQGVSFRLNAGEKVALIGRNGEGKTTLLKALAGELELDQGSINRARGAELDYLSQVAHFAPGTTVRQVAEESRKHVLDLRVRLTELETRLENNPTPDELEEFSVLHEHFLDNRGYAAETDVRLVLNKMGFDESEFGKKASRLSGGEKTRLTLARILLEEPDLLLLDEPTNHLDLDGVEWLEEWLRNYRGAVIAVSHDRRFLENVATRVIEMRDHGVTDWQHPFNKYLQLRELDEARRADVVKKQQKEIDALDEFVRRFMNSERVAQARGRLRHLERKKAERIEAPKQSRKMSAGIKVAKRSGDLVLESQGITKSYEAMLFSDVDWTVRRGERWGVIGGNGAGKSTLIKCILGVVPPDAGAARIGANVEIGYFSQDATELDHESTPLEILNRECDMEFPEARNLLGRFLLSGEQVFQPVATLSGGEKNKLSLAKITAMKPNTLILDEPTNHLDMDSREALAQVLKEFDGTLVLVSHDRHLLENVTDHTLDVRADGLRQYPGSYAEYRASLKAPVQRSDAPVALTERPTISPREISKEIGRLEKEIERVESIIANLEKQLSAQEKKLEALDADSDFTKETSLHAELSDELSTTISEWEAAVHELEALRGMQGA